jgi:hypothetical protein
MRGDRTKTLVVEVKGGIIDILIVKAVVRVGSANDSIKNEVPTKIDHHLVAEVLLLVLALIIVASFRSSYVICKR